MMTLKDQWADWSDRLAGENSSIWSGGSRKILREKKVTFTKWDDSLQAKHLGYTPAKLKQLGRNYLDVKSRSGAVEMWEHRREVGKFGSVAFSTVNHVVKGGETVKQVIENRSEVGSIVGPCMLGVSLTWLDRHKVAIDVAYRSTEFFKKLPADLVFLRDELLNPFDLSGMSISVTLHLANVTLHPLYWAVVLPHLDDPVDAMQEIARKDPKFHGYLVKATADYLCPEKGDTIANFASAQRVKKHATGSITGTALRDMQQYLRKHAA